MRVIPPVLVIAVGNDLRGDDAAGWRVADILEAWNRPGVRIVRVHQLVPELADDFATVATVVILDAAVGGTSTLELRRVEPDSCAMPLTHTTSASRLVALASQLHGQSAGVWQLAVPVETFEFGAAPSPRCQAGIDAAIDRLFSMLPGG